MKIFSYYSCKIKFFFYLCICLLTPSRIHKISDRLYEGALHYDYVSHKVEFLQKKQYEQENRVY